MMAKGALELLGWFAWSGTKNQEEIVNKEQWFRNFVVQEHAGNCVENEQGLVIKEDMALWSTSLTGLPPQRLFTHFTLMCCSFCGEITSALDV